MQLNKYTVLYLCFFVRIHLVAGWISSSPQTPYSVDCEFLWEKLLWRCASLAGWGLLYHVTIVLCYLHTIIAVWWTKLLQNVSFAYFRPLSIQLQLTATSLNHAALVLPLSYVSYTGSLRRCLSTLIFVSYCGHVRSEHGWKNLVLRCIFWVSLSDTKQTQHWLEAWKLHTFLMSKYPNIWVQP